MGDIVQTNDGEDIKKAGVIPKLPHVAIHPRFPFLYLTFILSSTLFIFLSISIISRTFYLPPTPAPTPPLLLIIHSMKPHQKFRLGNQVESIAVR